MTWSIVPIGTVARVVSGATPSTSCPEYWGGTICWATPKDISELNGSKFLDNTPRKLTEAGLRSCSAEVLPPNSVLFSSRAPIGLLAINRVPTATNQGFKSFVPDPSKLDTGYLFQWLRAHRGQIERMGVGATFREVSKSIVSRIEIPLPPLDEQRRIAAILDQAEELRAKRRAAIALLDQLPQAIFLEMFGDPATNPMGWRRVPIESLVQNTANWNPAKLSGTFQYVDISSIDSKSKEIVGIRQIVAADAPSRARQRIQQGDVLVSTVRPNLNAVAVVREIDDTGTASTGFCVLRPVPERSVSAYLFSWVRSKPFIESMSRQATGASYPAVTDRIVKAFEVFDVPLDLQRQFAARVQAIHRAKAVHLSALDESDALFASFQNRAFAGGLS